jgi:hypothetical protein
MMQTSRPASRTSNVESDEHVTRTPPRGGNGDLDYETDVTESELAMSTACSSNTSLHDDLGKLASDEHNQELDS